MGDQLPFDESFCHLHAGLPPPTPPSPTPPLPSGYETVYKGKFHLVKPAAPENEYTQQDLATYGYARWNPPDAGADQSLPEGGGNPLGGGNNDVRCAHALNWQAEMADCWRCLFVVLACCTV